MRKISGVISAILLTILTAAPVLAVVSYTAIISVTSNSTYTNLPIIETNNNSFLAANGYISASGLDVQIQSGGTPLPRMLVDNRTLFVSNLLLGTNSFNYVTGQTPTASMEVVTGQGGNITIANSISLALGSSFNLTFVGYSDTTTPGKIWDTPASFTVNQSATGLITTSINATVQQTTQNNSVNVTYSLGQNATPAGAGNYTNIGTLVGAPTHWQAVATDDGDTTYIEQQGTTSNNDTYTLSAVSIPAGHVIVSVSVAATIKAVTDTGYYMPILRLNGVETVGNNITDGSAVYHTDIQVVARPGGGNWSVADLSSLQVGLALSDSVAAPSAERCTAINVIVNYTNIPRIGQQLTLPASFNLTGVDLNLKKVGSPTGTANLTVRSSTNDSILATMGTLDVSTLTGAFAFVGFNTSTVLIPATNVRILLELPTTVANTTDYVVLGTTANNVTAGNLTIYSGTVYSNNLTDSANIRLWLNGNMTATGIASGARTLKVNLSSGNLSIQQNGVTTNSTIGNGLAVVSNTNGTTLLTNNVMPYTSNITLYINGTQVLWYSPNSIIIGSNLPNRASSSDNATLNFGANPAGITVSSLGTLTPGSSITSLPSLQGGNTPDVLPNTVNIDPTTTSTPTNPLSPFISALATLYDFTALSMWFWFGLIVTIAVFIGMAKFSDHLGWTLIATSLAMGGFSVIHVFPIGMLYIAILILITGVVVENRA